MNRPHPSPERHERIDMRLTLALGLALASDVLRIPSDVLAAASRRVLRG